MSKFLDALDDMEVDRILRLSHAELVAEIKARGEDPDKIVREINDTMPIRLRPTHTSYEHYPLYTHTYSR